MKLILIVVVGLTLLFAIAASIADSQSKPTRRKHGTDDSNSGDSDWSVGSSDCESYGNSGRSDSWSYGNSGSSSYSDCGSSNSGSSSDSGSCSSD
jgi:hypothetical protein